MDEVRPMTPAGGWFVDPYDPRQLRWWNGSAWTSDTRPLGAPVVPVVAPGPPPSAAAADASSGRGVWLAVGAAAVLLVAGVAAGLLLVGAGDDEAVTASDRRHRAEEAGPGPTTSTVTTTTDPSIGPAFEAEVSRACAAINADPGLTTESVIHFDDRWATAGFSFEQLQRATNECAQPARDSALDRISFQSEVGRACDAITADPGRTTESVIQWNDDWSDSGLTYEQLQAAVNSCSQSARDAALARVAAAEAAAAARSSGSGSNGTDWYDTYGGSSGGTYPPSIQVLAMTEYFSENPSDLEEMCGYARTLGYALVAAIFAESSDYTFDAATVESYFRSVC